MTQHNNTEITPQNSRMTVVFKAKDLDEILMGSPLIEGGRQIHVGQVARRCIDCNKGE